MSVDKTKNTQLLLTVPNDLLKEIEKFWRDNGIKNRSEGIRVLMRTGLKKNE
jgi:metal-responsive CopG/Arc/MetJ family transcriptional regulator